MKPRKVKTPLPCELGQGRRQVQIQGRTHHEDVSEKMGADGVMETHISYMKTEAKYYGKPKDRYCGQCQIWILENYKTKPHGHPCVKRRKK